MSDRIETVIADAIWHALDDELGTPHSGVDMAVVATGFLAALKAARIAVVELPPVEVDDFGDQEVKVALTHGRAQLDNPKIRVERRTDHRPCNADLAIVGVSLPLPYLDGPALAASILAATAAAAVGARITVEEA